MRVCKICNATIKRGYSTHRESVRHRYAKQLSIWLRDESMSFAEMSRRLNISRERVRQLAALRPSIAKGRDRQKKAALLKGREAMQSPRRASSRVIRELEARGIAWDAVRGDDPYTFSKRVITVGESPALMCSVQRFGRRPTGYYHIAKSAKPSCDFYIFVGPAGILIFPPEARPRTQTTFLLGRSRRASGIPDARHDWAKYLNAWHLIEGALKSRGRKSK